jgi:hypothetical protein
MLNTVYVPRLYVALFVLDRGIILVISDQIYIIFNKILNNTVPLK